MERWKDGWSIEWQPGRVAARSSGNLIGWQPDRVAARSASHSIQVHGVASFVVSIRVLSVAMR
ncbi:hypothetical protein HanPI659440_Chr17g0690461 [Helianthus annuus]|nr:hypothetical protein HanPI659440_Chr17g0690461 [Helianthus annuus]